MSARSAPDRRADVALPGGLTLAVDGRAAELCALVATTPLSARTLRLLALLVLEESRLAPIDFGQLTVDLSPTALRLHLRESRPNVTLTARDLV